MRAFFVASRRTVAPAVFDNVAIAVFDNVAIALLTSAGVARETAPVRGCT